MGFLSPAANARAQSPTARVRRGGVFASVVALHLFVLWGIATVARVDRPVLPTFMQVLLIPETPSPAIVPPPVVPVVLPNFKTEIPMQPLPLPNIDIAREISAPAQPLVAIASESKAEPMVAAAVAAPEPSPPAPVAVAPTAPAIPPAPAPVRAASPPPPPINIPPSAIQYLQMPVVNYPTLSKRRRETGLVIVSTLVDKDGRPVQTQILQSSGFDRLDEAAIAAVRQARFKPYVLAGQATAGWARIPISFDLDT